MWQAWMFPVRSKVTMDDRHRKRNWGKRERGGKKGREEEKKKEKEREREKEREK